MQQMDLKDFIIPTELENSSIYGSRDTSFNTKDYIFIDASYEILDHSPEKSFDDRMERFPTDYAIANGYYWNKKTTKLKKGAPFQLTKNLVARNSRCEDLMATLAENLAGVRPYCERFGIVPAMRLDIAAVTAARSESKMFGEIRHVRGDGDYYTIDFGFYPKTRAKNTEGLEKMFNNGRMMTTGKKYLGYMNNDGKYIKNVEYEYRGELYVRTQEKCLLDAPSPEIPMSKKECYVDGALCSGQGYVWIKVEPITWIIRNWDEMPKEINPKGNGRAKFMDVRAENVLISGIPFLSEHPSLRHPLAE